MKPASRFSFTGRDTWQVPLLLALVIATCFSMTIVLHGSAPAHPDFWRATAIPVVVCAFIPMFLMAAFSFGYVAGIGFYSMIAGFFWMSFFTAGEYDHVVARWSAFASLLLFLLPALFQTIPLPRLLMLSPRAMSRLMRMLLAL